MCCPFCRSAAGGVLWRARTNDLPSRGSRERGSSVVVLVNMAITVAVYVTDSYFQHRQHVRDDSVRLQPPRDDPAPGFLLRSNKQFVALRLWFGSGFSMFPTSNSIHTRGTGRLPSH